MKAAELARRYRATAKDLYAKANLFIGRGERDRALSVRSDARCMVAVARKYERQVAK